MFISIEEEQNTLEYQETMNVDVENIANNNNEIRDQYTKLLIIHFCSNKTFPTELLDQCINNPNQPQKLTSEVKVALKNGYGTRIVCKSRLIA